MVSLLIINLQNKVEAKTKNVDKAINAESVVGDVGAVAGRQLLGESPQQ